MKWMWCEQLRSAGFEVGAEEGDGRKAAQSGQVSVCGETGRGE